MIEVATKSPSRLQSISNLLEAFHANGILYCHWKSNEHLDVSMTGDTDLDVLFDEKQKVKIESILNRVGFKLFTAIKQKQYKDIVDYIGLDLQSGKVIHLHTHYKLTMGEPFLKGYQINFEEKILQSRIYNEEFGIYCINPSFELILLYLRESLKLRHRDILLIYLKNKIQYNEFVLKEYNWLKARTSDSEIHAILKTIFRDYETIYSYITNSFNRKQLRKLAPIVKKEFAANRLYSPFVALWLRWYREFTIIISRKLARILAIPILSKRINPRGGVVVAIIGADGSGKSTVTTNLKATFETKLDVYKIYFGRGDGKSSLGRKVLMLFRELFIDKKNNKPKLNQQVPANKNKEGLLKTLYKCIEALLVAREKSKNMKQLKVAKQRGLLVICDRYPQNQIMGYNDGPLLHDLLSSRNMLFRLAAKMESKIYILADNNPPDILFKLIADAQVVEARKPGETSLVKLEAKIAGIKQLKLNAPCKVITIDATIPLKEVLYSVKNEIWHTL